MPILQGRLKGKKWIVGSGRHGYWLGSYENKERILFEKTIQKDKIVFDIGAQAGFYTLLASELVGGSGKVFAFEPLPENIEYLKKHLQLNHVENVTIIDAAVSGECGLAPFKLGVDNSLGRIASEGTLKVKTVGLDALISKGELPEPDYIKIDAEGAELEILRGAQVVLKSKHPTMFISVHGKLYDDIAALLASLNYKWCGIHVLDPRKAGALFATGI